MSLVIRNYTDDSNTYTDQYGNISGVPISYVLKYLNDPLLNIPPNQRHYSWDKKAARRLYNTLLTAYNNGRQVNIGDVIIHNDGNLRFVYDGQQRLITLTIALKCQFDALTEIYEDEYTDLDLIEQRKLSSAMEVLVQLLYDTRDHRGMYQIDDIIGIARKAKKRLTIGYLDRKFFSDVFLSYGSFQRNYLDKKTKKELSSLREPQQRIIDTYRIAREMFVDSVFAKYESASKRIDMIAMNLDAFTKVPTVFVKETDDPKEASDVFIAINDMNVRLSSDDKLRNLSISLCQENDGSTEDEVNSRIDAMASLWAKFEEIIPNSKKRQQLERYYWNIVKDGSACTEALYYDSINESVSTYDEIKHLIGDIIKLARPYSDLSLGTHEIWGKKTPVSKKMLDIKHIDETFSTYYPIVLAMFLVGRYTDNDYVNVLNAIDVVEFRDVALGKIQAKGIEQHFQSIAKKIYVRRNDEDMLSSSDISTMIYGGAQRSNSTTYHNLRSVVMGENGVKNSCMKRILIEVENAANPAFEKQIDWDSVQIEHIMPRTIPKGQEKIWGISSDDEHKKDLNMLGNLTILYGSKNSKASNKPFKEKKAEYETSNLSITRELTQFDEWSPQRIYERQEKLAHIILKIWNNPMVTDDIVDVSVLETTNDHMNDIDLRATTIRIKSVCSSDELRDLRRRNSYLIDGEKFILTRQNRNQRRYWNASVIFHDIDNVTLLKGSRLVAMSNDTAKQKKSYMKRNDDIGKLIDDDGILTSDVVGISLNKATEYILLRDNSAYEDWKWEGNSNMKIDELMVSRMIAAGVVSKEDIQKADSSLIANLLLQ